MCLVCGRDNPLGLAARFHELEGGELCGVFRLQDAHQSYPGRAHGGICAAILDETIGRALGITEPDSWGVTIELAVKFRHPVPTDAQIRAVARVTKRSSRIFEGSGEILLADGTVAVQATGRYLRQPIERIVTGDFSQDWFPDERPAPDRMDV
jgi:uncharacterized protein (TIGR00369 family)